MLKRIALLLLVVIAAVLAIAVLKPDTFRVQRSVLINAPPGKIAPLLRDLHNWPRWSPWERRDPAIRRSYRGPAEGKGAQYAWSGNKEVGTGRMEVLSGDASRVLIQLDFEKPFESSSTAEFILQPQDASTRVTWAMYGRSPFPARVMSVFASMDKLVGEDFEQGLQNLKAEAEK